MLKLCIDDRERAISLQRDDFILPTEVKRITIGDFALLRCREEDGEEDILAVFERKTLKDYASSIKDGRHENREKMLELRRETNCKVYYLVEGPLNPSPSTTYGKISYSTLQSSMDHLTWRDDIHVIRTPNLSGTIERLNSFCRSIGRLLEKEEHLSRKSVEGLSKKHVKTPEEIVVEMWRCLPGVGFVTARKNLDVPLLRHVKESTLRPEISVKLLGAVPMISRSMARQILQERCLEELLEMNEESLSRVKLSEKRCLGKVKAKNILFYFNYTRETPKNV